MSRETYAIKSHFQIKACYVCLFTHYYIIPFFHPLIDFVHDRTNCFFAMLAIALGILYIEHFSFYFSLYHDVLES